MKPTTIKPRRRNAFVVAMNKRHRDGGRMRSRRDRRSQDAGRCWRREWE
jgi:hypothetical protein